MKKTRRLPPIVYAIFATEVEGRNKYD